MVTPSSSQLRLMRPTQLPLGQRELPAVVDALDLLGVLQGERVHAVARVVEDRDHVGEVVLALGVVGGEPAQRGPEQVAAEAVDGGVDLLDGPLLGGGVGLLDHPGDEAVLVPHQPSVPGRLGHVGGQDGGTVPAGLVEGDELLQRLRSEQRACRRGR